MKHTDTSKTLKSAGLITCLTLLASILILVTPSFADEDPGIVNIGVKASERLVLVDALLIEAFTESTMEAVESGVPLSFTYKVELVEKVDVLPDKTVSRNTVVNTVQYDSLKGVYTFTSNGKGVKRKVVTKRPKRFQELMLTLQDIPLAPLHKLDEDVQYFVRVRAEMEAEGFGFPFNYLLFFVPFDEFETDWAESSPLILDPDLTFSIEANEGEKSSPNESDSRGIKNVVRSFN